jgi:hypothetical protein
MEIKVRAWLLAPLIIVAGCHDLSKIPAARGGAAGGGGNGGSGGSASGANHDASPQGDVNNGDVGDANNASNTDVNNADLGNASGSDVAEAHPPTDAGMDAPASADADAAPAPPKIIGVVRRYESSDPASFRDAVQVTAWNVSVPPTPPSTTATSPSTKSSADGTYRLDGVPPSSLADLHLVWTNETLPDGQSLPKAMRTLTAVRVPESGALTQDIPVVNFTWVATVAAQCGIFATMNDALYDKNPDGGVSEYANGYFVTRSTIFGELRDGNGQPVANIPASALHVVLGGWTNYAGNPSDTDAHPAKVCFLDVDPTTHTYVGTTGTKSTATGRFVVFRLRNMATATGDGPAVVHVKDDTVNPPTTFAPAPIYLLSSGSLGVVTLTLGPDPDPPVIIPTRSFATDIYPLFAKLGCRDCHQPGQQGYEMSPPRGPMNLHLDLSGSVMNTWTSLQAGGQANCGDPTMPARVCPSNPPKSLLLQRPLTENPPDHPNASFDDTSDPDYQKILQWITQGALNN